MMNCDQARSFVDAWERGEPEAAPRLGAFLSHLGGCASCSARFSGLAGLFLRDLGSPAEARRSADRGFVDAVMARVEAKGRATALRPRRGPLILRSRFVALAAAAIFIVGLGLGLLFDLPGQDRIKVRFVLDAPDAQTVFLAGDFTAWRFQSYELHRAGPGSPWELSVPLKKGRLYSYNFVIDGKRWIVDPSVAETVNDGFGGSSSLMRL